MGYLDMREILYDQRDDLTGNLPGSKDPEDGFKYALIEKVSTYIPGDERSRTNPGHGYPEHYETSTRFAEFPNKQALLEYLERIGTSRASRLRIIKFQDVKVSVDITVH